MSVQHYENFPVASVLLPRPLRGAVTAIYRFARSADDIADEGDAAPQQRLAALAAYHVALDHILAGTSKFQDDDPLQPIFEPLAAAITQFSLPMAPFHDLLHAFEQDVTTSRYMSDTALLDYCSRSANPVGRLVLHLHDAATSANLERSDSICTGLQLANFCQDVALDWNKSRIYLPRQAMDRYGVSESDIAQGRTGPQWHALMQARVQQARGFLLSGLPLASNLPGRAGFELKLAVHGGLRILERLDQLHYDIFRSRPTLHKRDWVLLFWRALC